LNGLAGPRSGYVGFYRPNEASAVMAQSQAQVSWAPAETPWREEIRSERGNIGVAKSLKVLSYLHVRP
jgi:hypothetical protein